MDSTTFLIGEKEYSVVKYGWSQAKQVSDFGAWMANYGASALRTLTSQGDDLSNLGVVDILGGVLGSLSPEALLDLFILVFGCTRTEAEKYFDISLLVDGAIALYNNQPSIKRVLSRFFSAVPSESTAQDTSTPSE